MISFASNQIFLVTGASSGLGMMTVLLLNGMGATIIATGRNQSRLNEMFQKCITPERLFLEQKDLTENMKGLSVWVCYLAKKYGKLSGLVCCAGIADPMTLQLFDIDAAQKIFNTNYFAPLMLARGFMDKCTNVGSGASIVFVSSIASVIPLKGQVGYAGSKGALVSSVFGLSQEAAKTGVRVNCISPGLISTPMTDNVPSAVSGMLNEEAKRTALNLGNPRDVAQLTAFLLSDCSRWITGQNLIIDGGRD